MRADEVVLDREQERLVLGELDKPALRFRIEIAVERYRSVPDGGPRGTTPTTAGGPNE